MQLALLKKGYLAITSENKKDIGPSIGLLGKSLESEHAEIKQQLQRIGPLLTDMKLKRLSGSELATKYNDVKRDIEATYRLVNDHLTTEDSILNLLLKAKKENK
jgi:hypothetical protein